MASTYPLQKNSWCTFQINSSNQNCSHASFGTLPTEMPITFVPFWLHTLHSLVTFRGFRVPSKAILPLPLSRGAAGAIFMSIHPTNRSSHALFGTLPTEMPITFVPFWLHTLLQKIFVRLVTWLACFRGDGFPWKVTSECSVCSQKGTKVIGISVGTVPNDAWLQF